MSTHIGGNGIYPGSFNPPHIGHIRTIRMALECFDVLHLFVRYNEGVDLVDWDTKKGWFERINEEVGGHLVIHRMENRAVTGKTYTTEDFFEFIRNTIRSVGEPVAGFVFGDDYGKLMPVFQKEFPEMYFFRGELAVSGGEKVSSTAIREDPERTRKWLPPYVYETLHRLRERDPEQEKNTASGMTGQALGKAGSDNGVWNDETIDLTRCPVLGNGFGSTIYGLDEKTIVKVYKDGTPLEKVRQEYELSNEAYQSLVPSVRVYRMVRVGSSFGLVMERLARSLGMAIHEHPEQIEAYVDQYTALAKKLHHTRAEDTIPPVRDRWLAWARRLARWCSPDEVSLVCDLIERMPDAHTFLHGDFHPGNVMFRGEEPVLIDMTELGRGSYLCDLAVIYRGLIMGPQSKNTARREKSMGMSCQEIRAVGDLFFMKYLGLKSREALDEVYSRLHVLYALSVVVMCGKERMKDDALARLLMDELLRKVVVPGKNVILEIWRDGLLPADQTSG